MLKLVANDFITTEEYFDNSITYLQPITCAIKLGLTGRFQNHYLYLGLSYPH